MIATDDEFLAKIDQVLALTGTDRITSENWVSLTSLFDDETAAEIARRWPHLERLQELAGYHAEQDYRRADERARVRGERRNAMDVGLDVEPSPETAHAERRFRDEVRAVLLDRSLISDASTPGYLVSRTEVADVVKVVLARGPHGEQPVAPEDAWERINHARVVLAAAQTELADQRAHAVWLAHHWHLHDTGENPTNSLRQLGERFGVTKARAQQLVDRGKQVHDHRAGQSD